LVAVVVVRQEQMQLRETLLWAVAVAVQGPLPTMGELEDILSMVAGEGAEVHAMV